jgi:serine protease Do
MNVKAEQIDFQGSLAAEVNALCQRAIESLVIIHNGRHGAGAGLIWDQDGSIVTNYHVVRKSSPRVSTLDGSEYAAEIIAKQKKHDLAVLKIQTREKMTPALRADSRQLRVGQYAMAVGHPWGQIGAVSAGIVTSLGSISLRWRRGAVDVIRTDASLAPGNSGGPLLDARGQVIGINTMIMGGDQGVAIPIHVVEEFVSREIGQDSTQNNN